MLSTFFLNYLFLNFIEEDSSFSTGYFGNFAPQNSFHQKAAVF